MHKILSVFLLAVLLSACAPSAQQIQAAIAQTQQAAPTALPTATAPIPTRTIPPSFTPPPTSTVGPTETPAPTNTPIPTATTDPGKARQDLEKAFVLTLEAWPDVSAVNMVRISDHLVEIEFKEKWASQDRQPNVHYEVVRVLSSLLTGSNPELSAAYGGGEVVLKATSYSADGDYRFQSETSQPALIQLYDKRITFDEWKAAANADFR